MAKKPKTPAPKPEPPPPAISKEDWEALGVSLFGEDQLQWKFTCPACGHIASVQDYIQAGAPEGAVAFSCIGRWTKAARDAFTGKGPGPCNYAGGGLFSLNPISIKGRARPIFDFARDHAKQETKEKPVS